MFKELIKKINPQGLMELIIVPLVILLIFTLASNNELNNKLENLDGLSILKCKISTIEGNKSIIRVLGNTTEYEIVYSRLNHELPVDISFVNQTQIDYDNTIVSTWVFKHTNITSYKVVVRMFHSLKDYLVGNNDPRTYVYYCGNGKLVTYMGNNTFKLGNPLAYQIGDLSSYCSKGEIAK
jgi:hypothetical protein